MHRPIEVRLVAGMLFASIAFLYILVASVPNNINISLAVLACIGVACLLRLRANGNNLLAGSSALVLLVMTAVYGIGLLARPAPVFGINPEDSDFAIITIGMVGILMGVLSLPLFLPDAHRREVISEKPIVVLGDRKLIVIALIAMSAAIANYATGGIPILSNDVNGSRFTGNYGVLGRLWPLILPTLQVIVIVAAIRVMNKHSTRVWNSLGLSAFVFLVLSGGRSLFVIPLIAVALSAIDIYKPRVITMVLSAAAGVTVIGAFGYARTLGSSGSQNNLAYLGMRDQDSWLGSLDISVQTGPRVFSAVRESALDSFLGGQFFFADLQSFIGGHALSSDRLVTSLLNRDPAVVGGLPPTVFGGLYIDWGLPGVIAGSLLIGFLLELFRRSALRKMTLSSLVWFYYFATYVLLSVYSYVSAKPTILMVALISIFCFDRSNEVLHAGPNGVKVPKVPGWRRNTY